ncbi:MAG: M23 family metallopeptidase, partial [Anaerolineae bacterium]|nr:M23 family metallopeptidase [Anaerolineae bacterium]
FGQTEDGAWWGLLAIGMPHAQAGVGLDTPGGDYPLRLTAQADDGTAAQVELTVAVREGQYPPTVFDPGPALLPLLDPELRAAEATRLQAMFKQGASEPLWQGRFVPPINTRVTGGFQVARIIPDGSLIFHEGLDYATAYGSPARAAAHGVVALAEPLTVRGNTIYIDHGMGVFSGYFHLSQILVEPGEEVAPGQIIGRVGSTGLSTGPHLHFEIRLNGYNVSPSQWLQFEFP